jgi:hypothetical protein
MHVVRHNSKLLSWKQLSTTHTHTHTHTPWRIMWKTVLWNMLSSGMTPCDSSKRNRRVGGIFRLYVQGNKIRSLVTLMMEVICSSETLVPLTRATLRHVPEDNILRCYSREKYSRRQRSSSLHTRVYYVRFEVFTAVTMKNGWCLLGCYAVWLL